MNKQVILVSSCRKTIFWLINATVVVYCQGHGNIIQYIYQYLHFIWPRYLKLLMNGFDLRRKGRGNDWKHNATTDRSALTHWGRMSHICHKFVWTIACRLLAAKPLSDPMLIYCRLDPSEQTSGELLLDIHIFSFRGIRLIISSAKWLPFCLGLNVLFIP